MTIRVRQAVLFLLLLVSFSAPALLAQGRVKGDVERGAFSRGDTPDHHPASRRPPDGIDWTPAPHVGSFTLEQSQLGVTVVRGQSVSITLDVIPSGGFSDPVQITSPGGMAGGSVSIDPPVLNSPYDQLATFTISTTTSTSLGMRFVEIRAEGGGVVVNQGVYVDVVEAGAGTFEIYLSREEVDVVQGSSGSVTVNTSKSGDFTAPVEYTIGALPAGITVTGLPHVAQPPNYEPFAIDFAAAESVAAGTYEVILTGTGGGKTDTQVIRIRVSAPAAGDYTVTVSPSPVTFAAHPARGTFTFTITSTGGFSGPVEVSMVTNGNVVALAKGCPEGEFCPFVPITYTVPAGGSVSDEAIASTTGPGGGTIYVVTRTPGIDEKHTPVPVVVGSTTSPDYMINVDPSAVTLPQGGSTGVTLTLVRSGGFTDAVTVTADPSTGLQATTPVTFAPGETVKVVTVAASVTAPPGAGYIIFYGSGAGVGTRSASMEVAVIQAAQPDFTISLNPAAMTLTQGNAGSTTFTVQRANGFAGPVNVTVAPPNGVTADPLTFIVAATETSRTVTLNAAANAPVGPAPVTFTASAPEIGKSLTATLQLTVSQAAEPANFTIAATPEVTTIESGGTRTITLTLTRQNFSGGVIVTATATPAGLTVPPVTFGANETTRDVEVAAAPDTPAGPGSIVFTATAPDLPTVTRSAAVALTVTSQPVEGAPLITGITPPGAVAGTQSLQLLLTGENFAFGAQVVSSDSSIRIDATDVQLSSLAAVTLSIDPFAPAGRYRLNLVNPNGATTSDGIDFLVYEEGDIGAPLGVTSAAILSPLAGKTISPLERPNAVGIVATSGSGTISGRWLLDGGTFDQFTITVSAGEPTIVTSHIPIPASFAGRHRLQLVIDVPQYTQSAAINVTMAVESRTNLTILGPVARDGESTTGDEPMTLRWSMVPGALGYEVELEKNGVPFGQRIAVGQEAELALQWHHLAADPADSTVAASSFGAADPSEEQVEEIQRSAFRWRVAPIYCCSSADFYPGTPSEWSPLRIGPGAARAGRPAPAQVASAADPVMDAWMQDAAIAAAVPRAFRLASDANGRSTQSVPPAPVPAPARPAEPRFRKDWTVLPMLTTGYNFSEDAEQGTFQLSGQGDVGLAPLSSKYTTDFTGSDIFGDNFTFAGSRNWVVNVGNAARSTRAIRPEAIVGYAPPAFFQGAQLVTSSLARGGALVRAITNFGTASYYSSFTDALDGIMAGNFGMQQKIDAAAFELPAHQRYTFKILSLSVEDIPGVSQYAPPGEGRSIGFLGTFNVSHKLQITAEGARGDAEWRTNGGLRQREGDAFRVGLNGVLGRRMYRLDLSRTDADFVNPANRGFSTMALPNRTIGSFTLSTPVARGSANITLRHQLQTTSAVDATASGLNVSYNTPLGKRLMVSAMANYNVDEADENPLNRMPGTDRAQLGTSVTFSERFGRLNLSQTLAHQQLRDEINPSAKNDTDTLTMTGGGAVGPNMQLYASTTVMRMSGLSDNDSVTVSLTPSFTIPRTYISISPQISYSYSKNSGYGSMTRNQGERYATMLQWNPAWLHRLTALQLSANWNRNQVENPFQNNSSTGRSYVGTFTMKWGAGIGPATFHRTRAGAAPATMSASASQDPVNGRTPGRNH